MLEKKLVEKRLERRRREGKRKLANKKFKEEAKGQGEEHNRRINIIEMGASKQQLQKRFKKKRKIGGGGLDYRGSSIKI
jgi:hypothetical protein